MSNTSIAIPILQLNFATGTADGCIQAICGFSNTTRCGLEPREVETKIKTAIDAKSCPTDRSFVKITTTGVDKLLLVDQYAGTCTFNNAACAVAVCGIQGTAVNVTDGKSMCHSDPAVADAAVAGQYWFTTNGTACKDDKPTCKGFDDYAKPSSPAAKSGSVLNLSTSTPLAVLAVTTGLVGILGACGCAIA
ncbi:uncharacterized protein LOC62_02G002699 [Vanrija pseudolonga]|uniref:Uncharacterized protein n=1 Tax=Vanrija pseudolonga TaxID=143232 RepID=A0AAF0Y310_9TREE|nr:hypothetical protein LOC62_02G002699 [Vanrija pseudolonga]